MSSLDAKPQSAMPTGAPAPDARADTKNQGAQALIIVSTATCILENSTRVLLATPSQNAPVVMMGILKSWELAGNK